MKNGVRIGLAKGRQPVVLVEQAVESTTAGIVREVQRDSVELLLV